MDTHSVLVAARNLIDREGWGHKQNGRWEYTTDRFKATCASNAILRYAVGRSGYEPWDAFAAANGLTNGMAGIFAFNDAPGRTKEEVLAAFDRAIAETAPMPADPFTAGPVGRASFREVAA